MISALNWDGRKWCGKAHGVGERAHRGERAHGAEQRTEASERTATVCIDSLDGFLLNLLLTPKSQMASSGGDEQSKMQLSGFTSRNAMRREWQKARAASNCRMK